MRLGTCNLTVLSALAMLFACGCGGSAGGDGFKGQRGHVSGTVTLDGAALKEGSQVLFMAKTGGYTGAAVVDSAGKYTLKYRGGDGLPVGEYLVQLSPPVVQETGTSNVDPVQMGSKMALSRKSKPEGTAGDFPSKYKSTATSELFFNVKADQNTADFKLQSK